MPNTAERRMRVVALGCVGVAALAWAWYAKYHVVSPRAGFIVYVVNTLTGQKTFCDPTGCRALAE